MTLPTLVLLVISLVLVAISVHACLILKRGGKIQPGYATPLNRAVSAGWIASFLLPTAILGAITSAEGEELWRLGAAVFLAVTGLMAIGLAVFYPPDDERENKKPRRKLSSLQVIAEGWPRTASAISKLWRLSKRAACGVIGVGLLYAMTMIIDDAYLQPRVQFDGRIERMWKESGGRRTYLGKPHIQIDGKKYGTTWKAYGQAVAGRRMRAETSPTRSTIYRLDPI
jgi:hypothetical protein